MAPVANLLFPELQLQYTNYKNSLQQIAQKIGDVEQEAEEHKSVSRFSSNAAPFVIIPLIDIALKEKRLPFFFNLHATSPLHTSANDSCACRLVLETLEPLSEDRKCFRMINGVLIERTVKDVVPALKTNSEGLRGVLEDLVKQFNNKQSELEKWKVRAKGF